MDGKDRPATNNKKGYKMSDEAKAVREAKIQERLNAMFDAYPKASLPEGITTGYIGNLESWGDDRAWFIFRSRPGRVGTTEDRIGGYSTENRGKLLSSLRAISFAQELI